MENQARLAFGQHLTLDGYGCNANSLSDLSLVYRFLDEAPALIGMTKIMGPWADIYLPPQDKPQEDWGLSGCVIIAESHITIHTFPDKRFISLDIFSCKPFDWQFAIDHAVGVFKISHNEYDVFDRGLEFPRNRELAVGMTTSLRESISMEGVE